MGGIDRERGGEGGKDEGIGEREGEVHRGREGGGFDGERGGEGGKDEGMGERGRGRRKCIDYREEGIRRV